MLLRLLLCIGTTLLLFEGGAARSLYERASGALNFIVLGDWGGQDDSPYTTVGEENVAEQMGKTAAEVGSQFTLSLGDNFYENGVTDVDDPRFKNTFEVSIVVKKNTQHGTAFCQVCVLFAKILTAVPLHHITA